MTKEPLNSFGAMRDGLTNWLFERALPLWGGIGTDYVHGGFFEKISRQGQPVEEPRRTRVVGRQIYSFATAARIGWTGPAARVVTHGLDYFTRHCMAEDGRTISVSKPDGTIVDGRFNLYDQAFALFGLAAAARLLPDRGNELANIAAGIRRRMREGWAHPVAGFEETNPRSLPLKANQHMHLFEACLAWNDCTAAAGDSGWGKLADEIGGLCLSKFLHPENGCLREFFDGDWNPMPGDEGRIVEPGHQYEWAWLLVRWGRMRNRPDAFSAARKLVEIAETYGVDTDRGVAFNEIWDDFTPKDRRARLWPQTERIKAWLALASIAEKEAEWEYAIERATLAAHGLNLFLAKDVVGAWNERMCEDESFLYEPAPASSLYHITCAIAEMHFAQLKSR
jgi:mannose-6-phosphate isomerase